MNTSFIITMSALTLWEAGRMVFHKRLYAICKEYSLQRDSAAKRFYMRAHPVLKLMLLMDVAGLLACIVGMFTAFWYLFLFILLLSFFRIKSIGPVWFGIDAVLSGVLYGMVLADLIQ